jgi:hypothetical protein
LLTLSEALKDPETNLEALENAVDLAGSLSLQHVPLIKLAKETVKRTKEIIQVWGAGRFFRS